MRMLREWIDFEQNAIIFPAHVMKGRRPFSLPISDFMITILRRVLAEGDRLFPGTVYVFPSKSKTGHAVDVQERDVDLPTGHIVRHTYITHAKKAGIDRETRRLLVDHRDKDDIQGLYLHVPSLFADLLDAQEKMTAYLIEKTGAR